MIDRPQVWVMPRPPFEDDLLGRIAAVADVHRLVPEEGVDALDVLGDADAILGHIEADTALFDAAPRLRVLSTVSVGFNHIDVAEATRRGVIVCHTPGVLTRAVTDVTMALIFGLALRLRENEAHVRSGAWAARATPPPLGMDVRDKTLGIIGYGRIGRSVARRMEALGMRTWWFDREFGPDDGESAATYAPLDDLLAGSDFVSLHANWEPGSPPILGARELGLMAPTSYLINTARGALVDQVALTDALASGRLAGAGLDVLRDEPPSADERLVTLDNVVCYPHIASATVETRRAMRELAVENVLCALAGRRPPAPVNAELIEEST